MRVNSSRAPAVTLALAAASTAAAQNVYDYRAHAELNSVFNDRAATSYVGPLNVLVQDGTGFSAAASNLRIGVNKIIAVVQGTNVNNPIRTATAGGVATWSDVVTISHPQFNGQSGTLTARLRTRGAAVVGMSPSLMDDPSVVMSANWTAITSIGPVGSPTPQEFFHGGDWFAVENSFQYSGSVLDGYQPNFAAQFTFGQPFALSTSLQTTLLFNNNPDEPSLGWIDTWIDFGDINRSVHWGGISSIRNSIGNPITGATLTSNSQIQWTAEVDPQAAFGDFNADGRVNLGDYNILSANFGAFVAPWDVADATGDGRINLADYNVLAVNFGLTVGPEGPTPEDWAALASAVPEPAILSLAGAGATALMRRRKR